MTMTLTSRRLILAIPLLVFVVIFAIALWTLAATSRGDRDAEAIGFSMTGQTIPPVTMPRFDGGGATINLAEMRGRAYAINVFASWCAPCRLEALAIAEIADSVPVIGINYRDAPDAAAGFLDQFGNPYHRIGRDGDGSISIRLGVHGLPETFIINGDGVIIHHHQGPVFASDLAGVIKDAIDEAKATGGAQ